jgi:dipeptidyl aminopeptidase/acylaminoacyl peptidase
VARAPLALLFVAAALVALPAASAGFPGLNGLIAFTRLQVYPDGVRSNGSIFVIRADGRGLRRLTSTRAESPAWSPDGTRIDFVRSDGQLWSMNADGSAARRIGRFINVRDPDWSPDGSQIVFAQRIVRGNSVEGSRLAIVRADGSGYRRLTDGASSDSAPAWSPNGRWIAFLRAPRSEGAYRVLRVTPAGSRLSRLSGPLDDSTASADPVVAWTPAGGLVYGIDPSPDGRFRAQALRGPDDGWIEVWKSSDRSSHNLTSPSPGRADTGPAWQPSCSIRGTTRRDVLAAAQRRELVCGRGGDDTLVARAGEDRLFGGAGNDRILAANGRFDVVGCGTGTDRVAADRSDLVGVDCERVTRA